MLAYLPHGVQVLLSITFGKHSECWFMKTFVECLTDTVAFSHRPSGQHKPSKMCRKVLCCPSQMHHFLPSLQISVLRWGMPRLQ